MAVWALIIIIPFSIKSLKNTANCQNISRENLKKQNSFINIESDDKTLSPYFYVNSDNGTESLPLKESYADVNIAGVIADVKITQVYMNNGDKPIEAIYVFPASTRAAVYSMKMTVGDRLLVAKIKEKEQARQDYEQAKSQGKSATLLEQQRPNVFQMNVANIMPGDTISVELCYTELLIPESGIYEFVYPTVVGPRYSNQPEATASANDKWVSNPYLHEGEDPNFSFDFKATISAGMPIKQISCPTHEMSVNYDGQTSAALKLKESGNSASNRDLIIQYCLADNKIESGLLLYKGDNGENFFLTMIQPPKRPTVDQIPAREYIFIMDISGSMYGFPIETSKTILKNLVKNLRSTDKFNVMFFAGGSSWFAEQSVFATQENLNKAIQMIDNKSGGGGTELLPALRKALSIEKAEGFSRSYVIATDGYVDVERATFELVRNNLGNSNFFAFGIGSSVNRYLIEGIATAGMGESFIVTDPSKAEAMGEKFRQYIQTPVLTDVKVDFGNFDVYDVEPINVPDVLAERPVIIFGKYKGNPSGTIKVTGLSGSSKFNWSVDVESVKPTEKHSALKYLWARQKIRMIDDMAGGTLDEKTKEQVTALGLKYNLLTNYTSFIAIDSLVRNTDGKVTTVKQPLPLPQGVSDYAVGSGGYGYGAPSGAYKSANLAAPVYQQSEKSKDDSDGLEVEFSPTNAYFTGGEDAMEKFIESNLQYPEKARLAGISGKIHISFTVEASGNITNITVTKGLGYGCDEEAIRIVKLMVNKWTPATSGGVYTASKVSIVIKF